MSKVNRPGKFTASEAYQLIFAKLADIENLLKNPEKLKAKDNKRCFSKEEVIEILHEYHKEKVPVKQSIKDEFTNQEIEKFSKMNIEYFLFEYIKKM